LQKTKKNKKNNKDPLKNWQNRAEHISGASERAIRILRSWHLVGQKSCR